MNTAVTGIDVLIIEDDPTMAEIVMFGLGNAQYSCRHIADVNQVVGALKKERFKAIICDVNLSAETTGIDLYFELIKLGLHSGPFIFMTGQAFDWSGFERSSQSHLRPAIFFKPLSVSRIIAFLNDHLRSLKVPNVVEHAKVATPLPAVASRPAVSRDVLSVLRHELCNKVMIASESAQIGLLLMGRQASAPGYQEIIKRMEDSIEALNEVTALLEGWRENDNGSKKG